MASIEQKGLRGNGNSVISVRVLSSVAFKIEFALSLSDYRDPRFYSLKLKAQNVQ